MSHLVSHFLAASLNYYTVSKFDCANPLDFYAKFAPGGMQALGPNRYDHPAELDKQAIELLLHKWAKPMAWFDSRSITWATRLFPTEVIERAFTYMKPSATLPPDIESKLMMHLADLEQSLLAHDPMMPQHLKQSHQLLISYPETVHLLDDTEIARLISAAQIHSQIEIVKASVPKTGGRKKISADDL